MLVYANLISHQPSRKWERKKEKKANTQSSHTHIHKKIGRAKLEKFLQILWLIFSSLVRLCVYSSHSNGVHVPRVLLPSILCNFVYSALRQFSVMIHEQFANRFFHISTILENRHRYIVRILVFRIPLQPSIELIPTTTSFTS